jgi:hypothetical protein
MCRNTRIQPWTGRAFVCLLIGLALQSPAAFPEDQPAAPSATKKTIAPLILSGSSRKDGNSAKISAPVADVINLLEAKMSPDVIKAYVKSLSMAYTPTADELLRLTERGASTDILLALLQRGAEVMARSPQTQPIAYYHFPAPAIPYAYEPEPPAANQAPVTEEASEGDPSDSSHTETIIVGGPGPGPGFPPPGPPPRHPRRDHPAAPPGHESARGPVPGTGPPLPPPASARSSSHPAPGSGLRGRSR